MVEVQNYPTESSKVIEIGFIDKGTGKHESNMVFDRGGYCSLHHGKLRSEATAHNDNRGRIITLADLGVGGERGVVFDVNGVCPTQSATQYKDAIKVVVDDYN